MKFLHHFPENERKIFSPLFFPSKNEWLLTRSPTFLGGLELPPPSFSFLRFWRALQAKEPSPDGGEGEGCVLVFPREAALQGSVCA